MATVASLEEILDLVNQLSDEDKTRLAVHLVPWLPWPPRRPPRRSLYGVVKHLGPAPSAEDIDEMRREVWANFPRDDI